MAEKSSDEDCVVHVDAEVEIGAGDETVDVVNGIVDDFPVNAPVLDVYPDVVKSEREKVDDGFKFMVDPDSVVFPDVAVVGKVLVEVVEDEVNADVVVLDEADVVELVVELVVEKVEDEEEEEEEEEQVGEEVEVVVVLVEVDEDVEVDATEVVLVLVDDAVVEVEVEVDTFEVVLVVLVVVAWFGHFGIVDKTVTPEIISSRKPRIAYRAIVSFRCVIKNFQAYCAGRYVPSPIRFPSRYKYWTVKGNFGNGP
ncbi:hypothetical protein HDU79_011040 [Rhizoclosmatium sp. JEL0117]|nr:hypothetical protein HDU79_011040 [Rhizoclosmatium sp. JEL0117]